MRLLPFPRTCSGASALLIASLLVLMAPASPAAPGDPASRGESATEDDAEPSVQEVITVTATPESEAVVPATVTVIGREEIDRRQATSVATLLGAVPGLAVATTGGPGDPTSVFTRGTNSTQTLVLLDGVKLNNPNFSGYDFANLTTDAVERIEVVRGPFSALWGADAVGGVVNLISRREKVPFTGTAGFEGGQDGYWRANALAGGTAGIVDYFSSYAESRWEGEPTNDYYNGRNADLRALVAPISDLRAGITGHWSEGESGIPYSGGVGTPPSPNRRQKSTELAISLPVHHRVLDEWEYDFSISEVRTSLSFRDPADPYGFFWSDVDTRLTSAATMQTLTLGPSKTSLGGSWERREVDQKDVFSESLKDVGDDTWGVFLQEQLQVGRHFLMHAGLRQDQHEAFGSQLSPRAAVAFLWNADRDKVHASYGRSFRAPSVGELYYPGWGNANLRPERATSYELGYRHAFAGDSGSSWLKGNASLTYYYTRIEDLIQYDFTIFVMENIGKATTRGWELAATWEPLSSLQTRISYTYGSTKDLDSGQSLLRRPEHSAAVSVGYAPWPWLDGNVTATYVGKRDDIAIDYSRQENDAYARVDVALSGHAWFASPFVRVQNALDEKYEEALGYPAPARTFIAGIRLTY
ncbi:MAG: TonB-dependent receptor [Candidatus Schekmanbacteria bacterium]|nr:TonB-dependent receptor [Candidatus Schekmanbacteria bacterium]